MSAEHLGEPLGEAPHVALRLTPAAVSRKSFFPAGCVALLGKTTAVGHLKEQLCTRLELPRGAAVLMHEGRNLEDEKTLSQNDVVLPGPSARRRGDMPEILFDLTYKEMERQRQEAEHAEARAEQQRRDEVRRKLEEMQQEAQRQKSLQNWERTRMQQEEHLQRTCAQLVVQQRQAEQAQVLAALPVAMRRIEFTVDWGVTVEQRLREIAQQAGLSLEDCVRKVSVVTARGSIVMMFTGGNDIVPKKEDFPFVLVFGPVEVQVQGPAHQTVLHFAQAGAGGLPVCWQKSADDVCVPLVSSSDEFCAVSSYFCGTLGWSPDICSISRVQNEEVYSRFKGINEISLTIMFHGCRNASNESSILRNGFQVDRCVSGGSNYGTWCAYAASYSDSGFVFTDGEQVKHIFVVVVSRSSVRQDNSTMRVVGQDCVYPLWLVKYRPTSYTAGSKHGRGGYNSSRSSLLRSMAFSR